MDQLDELLNKFSEAIETGNKEEILKLNRVYGNNLIDLILSFSNEALKVHPEI